MTGSWIAGLWWSWRIGAAGHDPLQIANDLATATILVPLRVWLLAWRLVAWIQARGRDAKPERASTDRR